MKKLPLFYFLRAEVLLLTCLDLALLDYNAIVFCILGSVSDQKLLYAKSRVSRAHKLAVV
jgi:hypothetical protein